MIQGFGALEGMNGVQKFQIHRDDRSTDRYRIPQNLNPFQIDNIFNVTRLPAAHTCFNQLDLPAYEV